MGRGNSLTDHKKGMIDAFEKDGHSQREIAKKINRSRFAVNNYIKNKNKTPRKILGRPGKLSPRNKPAIIRDVRKSRKSVYQIHLPGEINVSRGTIWRTLKNYPHVEYSKGQKVHSWKEHHIKTRFSWAKKYVSFGEKMEWCCIYRREKMEFRWSQCAPLLLALHKEKKDF